MYIVYDPNHHVRLLTENLDDAYYILGVEVNNGEYPMEDKYIDGHIAVYMQAGVYIIHDLKAGVWIK